MTGFSCRTCGQSHEGLPLSYGAPAPEAWYALPSRGREQRAVLSPEHCIIDNKFFFLAGNLDIPVGDAEAVFYWTVWVSVSEASFNRAVDLWERPGRETEPPYFGWLNTSLPGYPPTVNLKVNLHTRPVGERPSVEVEPTEHPLAVEQRSGMTRRRVQEIAEIVLHGGRGTKA